MKGFFKDTAIKQTQTTRKSCASCGLYQQAYTPQMEAYGKFEKQIMIIEEAPDKFEDRRGKPWQGKAGQLLQETLKELGVDLFRDCISVYAVRCRTVSKSGKSRTPTQLEINFCQSRLLADIEKYKPKMILILGTVALKSLISTRWKKGIDGIEKWRGWCIPDEKYETWICPAYHPAYVLRNERQLQVELIWKQDLKRAVQKQTQPLRKAQYDDRVKILETKQEKIQFLQWLKRKSEFTFDLETTGLKPHAEGHEIRVIGFSVDGKWGYVMELDAGKEKEVVIELKGVMEDKAIGKTAHNMKYEDRWMWHVLGIEVKGWIMDTMLLTHVMDNRTGICSLSFQTYIRFGVGDYDSHIQKWFRSTDSNGKNKINEALSNTTTTTRKEMLKYCALDALFTAKLKNELEGQLYKEKYKLELKQAYQLLHDGALVLARVESNGLRIDTED